jgi:signal transduction histidine kinase
MAEGCVGMVRNMALLLRPSMLDDLGLVAAIHGVAGNAKAGSCLTLLRLASILQRFTRVRNDRFRPACFRLVAAFIVV